jgi:predicted kinase
MEKQKIAKQVADNFIAQLKITKRETKKPIVIAMVGLIGSGKTTVANELARLIKATVIKNDAIRIALRKNKQAFKPTRSIARRATLHVLKRGGNVILDSDYVDSEKRKKMKETVKKIQGEIFYIRTIADRDIMIGRLIKAKYNPIRDLFKNSVIAIREMWRRTPHHYRWESKQGGRFILRKLRIPFLAEIETDGDWKKEIKKIAQKIEKM